LKQMYRFAAVIFGLTIFIASAGAQESLFSSQQSGSVRQELINSLKIDRQLDFCGEAVPLQEAEIKERLEREMLYALDNNDAIILWLKRANRYFPHIEKVLKENSLPDDLKYIAIAESALKPHATSNKGAVGYWQFIESTGSKYGMEINADIDERRNFFTSTQKAITYLKELYTLFGSWTLAAAAYNMGEEGLRTDIMVQKVNNYYQLYLPQETQRYIFRILTIKIIMSNPEKYGFFLSKEDLYQQMQFDRVEITASQPVPIYIIAQAAKTYFKIIKDLNPHIKNYYIPAGKWQIMVPAGAASGFRERYEKFLQQWLTEKKERIYIVKQGDNLSNIAARFDVPVKAIMIWNGINNGKKVSPGDKLVIFSKSFKLESINGKNGTPEKPVLTMPFSGAN
jgi:membrane-bound lytic murein transglycosylase D